MTTITLEQVKAEQQRLADMIAAIESRAKRTIAYRAIEIDLEEGEHHAGILLGKDGQPDHHLILLPGSVEGVNWSKALEWAKTAGGELPTRREQSLLFANLKEQFEPNWYWSSEQHASYSDCAWGQSFGGGGQNFYGKYDELRARAVRRLVIL